jgi:hypothetical protein
MSREVRQDVLGKRLARYELTLHPDKTRFVDFRSNRPDGKDHPDTDGTTFTFLGPLDHRAAKIQKRRSASSRRAWIAALQVHQLLPEAKVIRGQQHLWPDSRSDYPQQTAKHSPSQPLVRHRSR